jgi:hypothetical protein
LDAIVIYQSSLGIFEILDPTTRVHIYQETESETDRSKKELERTDNLQNSIIKQQQLGASARQLPHGEDMPSYMMPISTTPIEPHHPGKRVMVDHDQEFSDT